MRTYRYISFWRNSAIAQKAARRRGAALVEFALIAVIFFTMLLGMIQFGIYQSTTNTLWNLSREGARHASIISRPSDDAIKSRVRDLAPSSIDLSKLTIEVFPPTTRTSGEPVSVCLTYDMSSKMIIPGIKELFNRDRTIPAQPPQPSKQITGYNYFTYSIMRVE